MTNKTLNHEEKENPQEQEVVELAVKPHYNVMQSNTLIEAKQVEPLTKNEQKLILTMISLIEPTDEDFKKYEISIRDLANILGLSENNNWVYQRIKATLKDIMKKTVELPSEEDKQDYTLVNWFNTADYISKEGKVKISFSPAFRPYLLQLKSAYTVYQLSNILNLSSAYSIRLYELMKMNEKIGVLEIDHETLRVRIGAVHKTFSRYYEFKTKILEKALEELNETTELEIGFEEVRSSPRKIEKLVFTISVKESYLSNIQNDAIEEVEEDGYTVFKRKLVSTFYNRNEALLTQAKISRDVVEDIMELMIEMFGAVSDDIDEIEKRVLKEFGYLLAYTMGDDERAMNPVDTIKKKIESAVKALEEFGIAITFKTLIEKEIKGKTNISMLKLFSKKN